MPVAQVMKWGNSLAVRIPKPLAEEAGFREGDPVEIAATRGQIKVVRKDRIPTLKELVSQITAENRYPETDMGPEQGKEKVEW